MLQLKVDVVGIGEFSTALHTQAPIPAITSRLEYAMHTLITHKVEETNVPIFST